MYNGGLPSQTCEKAPSLHQKMVNTDPSHLVIWSVALGVQELASTQVSKKRDRPEELLSSVAKQEKGIQFMIYVYLMS